MNAVRKSGGKVWSNVVEVVGRGDRAVRARVELALGDATLYVKKYARELAERGVTKPIAELPFIALLDGLDAAKRVALIDWKSPAEDVRADLAGLRPRVKIDWSWTKAFEEDELDDLSTERVLRAAAAHVPPNVVLVNLDTGSDQFAIAFVEAARVKPILAAMKAAGHRAEAIAPKAVAAPKRTTTIPREGTPMKVWPKCDADRFDQWRMFINERTLRNLYLIKYTTAFDVMIGPSWSTNTKCEKRTFPSAARCTAAYVKFYEQLNREGWLQFTEDEHAKQIRANAAAKKRGVLRATKRTFP